MGNYIRINSYNKHHVFLYDEGSSCKYNLACKRVNGDFCTWNFFAIIFKNGFIRNRNGRMIKKIFKKRAIIEQGCGRIGPFCK